MKSIERILGVGLVLSCCGVFAGCRTPSAVDRTPDFRRTTNSQCRGKEYVSGEEHVVYDDLEWLVGKWQCIRTEVLSDRFRSPRLREHPEPLEFFIVYFPFGYASVSLTLEREPRRALIAELVFRESNLRTVGGETNWDSWDGVWIGIDRIRASCGEGSVDFYYKYVYDESDSSERLELTSADARFILKKVSDVPPAEPFTWQLLWPKDPALIKLWRHDFQQEKFRLMNFPASNKSIP